jgi:hypothetical protein
MSSYFSFPCRIHDQYVLVIFKSDSYFDELELSEFVVAQLRTPSPETTENSETIIFVVSNYDYNEVMLRESSLRNALMGDDGSPFQNCVVLGFDEFGEFSTNMQNLRGDINNLANVSELPEKFRREGIKMLCEKNEVINLAPHGTRFIKPSGSKGEEFIRASLLQSSDAATFFLAYSLLHFWGKNKIVRSIYIDTMAISPTIYKLIQLKKTLNQNVRIPKIVSFHSYRGLRDVPKESIPESLIFISASNAGEMPRKIGKQWKISSPNEQIMTFLSFKEDNDKYMLLCKLNKISESRRTEDLSDIKIIGEFFSPAYQKPREVLLTHRHKPKKFDLIFRNLVGMQLFDIQKTVGTSNDYKMIYVNSEKLVETQEFITWLQSIIGAHAPVNISHIIHADDLASERISNLCMKEYEKYLHTEKLPKILPASELTNNGMDHNEEVSGILAISATTTKGNSLLSISRDLRSFAGDRCPRVFLTGAILSTSLKAYESLYSNLTWRSSFQKHTFFSYLHIPVDSDKRFNTWQKELEKLSSEQFCSYPKVKERLDILVERVNGLGENCFWTDMNGRLLVLRKTFAFWDFDYQEETISQAEIYLTISAVLQRAREGNSLNQDERLYSDEYQSALISPDCFLRFNDGIIQASILRAARPSELDYTISRDLSRRMRRYLVKMIRNWSSEQGEALPEFIVSLAIGYLRLVEADLDSIINTLNCIEIPPEYEFLGLLLESRRESVRQAAE